MRKKYCEICPFTCIPLHAIFVIVNQMLMIYVTVIICNNVQKNNDGCLPFRHIIDLLEPDILNTAFAQLLIFHSYFQILK